MQLTYKPNTSGVVDHASEAIRLTSRLTCMCCPAACQSTMYAGILLCTPTLPVSISYFPLSCFVHRPQVVQLEHSLLGNLTKIDDSSASAANANANANASIPGVATSENSSKSNSLGSAGVTPAVSPSTSAATAGSALFSVPHALGLSRYVLHIHWSCIYVCV